MPAITAFLKGTLFGLIISLIGCFLFALSDGLAFADVVFEQRPLIVGFSLVCGIVRLLAHSGWLGDAVYVTLENLDPFSWLFEGIWRLLMLVGDIFSAW